MTPNNLLFCEHCRSYTKHTFVVNVGMCKICNPVVSGDSDITCEITYK